MKKLIVIPALIAFGLVCISGVQNANAYFTTYVTAKGGYEVSWKHKETIEENFTDWDKYVTIKSEEDSIPVYIRAKAFAGSTYSLTYSGTDWSYNSGDGFYYYQYALNGGETTTALRISIDQIPLNPQGGENFNVVVIYESLPVVYDEDGEMISPQDADWSQTITSTTETMPVNPNQENSSENIVIIEGGTQNE